MIVPLHSQRADSCNSIYRECFCAGQLRCIRFELLQLPNGMLYQSLASGSNNNEPHTPTAGPDPHATPSQMRQEEQLSPAPNVHARASTPADALEASGALFVVRRR